MPDEFVANYRLIRKLGQGGMGEVWLALDTRLERQVALKLLPAELVHDDLRRQRFLTEAKAASALNHPNVCVVHEVGETGDHRPYIVMEHIEGRMLDARLREGPLPVSDIVSIGLQVADALEAAHERGVIHRDIKPSNIAFNTRGVVKVLDFGLAKRTGPELSADSAAPTQVQTRTGTVMGTPSYMSPEQALGRSVDGRSDLFSLGVVLYELTTGQLPFRGANFAEVLDQIVHHQPVAVARLNYDAPQELERVIRKCLEKDPGRRYQGAREVLVDLRNLLRDLDGATSSTRPAEEEGESPASPASPATGGLPAEPVQESLAPPTPDEIKQGDIFINCAQLDNRPMIVGQPGWVSQFQRNLEIRLQQLSGKDVKVNSYPNPAGDSTLDAQLLESVPEAKTMVSVVSPPFLNSEGCKLEVASFWQGAERSGNLVVQSRPRLFKVVKTPVDPQEVPSDLSSLLSRLMSFDFFERDPETGRVREFDEAFGERARQRYHERIYDLAHEICQVLKGFHSQPAEAPPTDSSASDSGKAIFLAVTTSDLQPQRDRLQRALVELGHHVLPAQSLPIVVSDLESAVRNYLGECDLAIHLVGEHYGLVPEGSDRSVVVLQNQWAAEQSRQSGLDRVIWMPRGLKPNDERQAAFIEQLYHDGNLHAGAEIIADTLENLKAILEDRWRQQAATEDRPARSPEGPPRVYLICDRADEQALEPIEDYLYEHGVEVSLPAFDLDETKINEAHMENLRDCDGALIFYGQASRSWVDIKARDIIKANAWRDARPIDARAVYMAPPFDRRKERYRTLSADLIRQEGSFQGNALDEFVNQVKQARR